MKNLTKRKDERRTLNIEWGDKVFKIEHFARTKNITRHSEKLHMQGARVFWNEAYFSRTPQ